MGFHWFGFTPSMFPGNSTSFPTYLSLTICRARPKVCPTRDSSMNDGCFRGVPGIELKLEWMRPYLCLIDMYRLVPVGCCPSIQALALGTAGFSPGCFVQEENTLRVLLGGASSRLGANTHTHTN